ncbi:MAG: MFS transporter [Anaerolineales bacterium]|jgi:MFS family permease
MKTGSRHRWVVVIIFFLFMFLHQMDKLLIGPLVPDIKRTFAISDTQMGAIATGALLVQAIMFPVWGYLYDRYARPKLLALASFIWGATTWLAAIAPSYGTFLAARASTGIDDSSYPGLYSLLSDYFEPRMRGKVYGLLQVSQPLGYLIGMAAATMLSGTLGWRTLFYITGSLGLALAIPIFFGVRDVPRGRAEPELAGLDVMGVYRFDKKVAVGLLRKPTLRLLFAQGFVGVFPWNVITLWIFDYLQAERFYDQQSILMTMAPAVLVLALGYFVGGWLGDFFFKRTRRGRILVSMVGVLIGAILLVITFNVPIENRTQFFVMLCLTALFIPFAAPNVVSTVHDVSLPEVRSTALSIQYLIENFGAAAAPLIAGWISDLSSLKNAFIIICLSAWAIGAILLAFTAVHVPRDIEAVKAQLAERAAEEQAA